MASTETSLQAWTISCAQVKTRKVVYYAVIFLHSGIHENVFTSTQNALILQYIGALPLHLAGGHMQVCISLQRDRPNHASTPPLKFLQARCPSCRPTNSVKALKALTVNLLNK